MDYLDRALQHAVNFGIGDTTPGFYRLMPIFPDRGAPGAGVDILAATLPEPFSTAYRAEYVNLTSPRPAIGVDAGTLGARAGGHAYVLQLAGYPQAAAVFRALERRLVGPMPVY